MRTNWRRQSLLGLVSVTLSCAPCYDSDQPNYTNYTIEAHERSKMAYGIDDPLHQLDRQRLDSIMAATLSCVKRVWPLSPDESSRSECMGSPVLEIRSCLTIKAAPDWIISPCTGNEEFGHAPDASCEAKGETPTAECPCRFRAIIQDNCSIVTAPNMEILSGQFVTLLTGCVNAWVGPLAECAQISVQE